MSHVQPVIQFRVSESSEIEVSSLSSSGRQGGVCNPT